MKTDSGGWVSQINAYVNRQVLGRKLEWKRMSVDSLCWVIGWLWLDPALTFSAFECWLWRCLLIVRYRCQ